MNITIKSPVQLFINGKFFTIVNEVEIKESSREFRKSIMPDNIKLDPKQFTGTVINIKKQMPLSSEDKRLMEEERKKNDYDEFYKKMISAVNDPDVHLPLD